MGRPFVPDRRSADDTSANADNTADTAAAADKAEPTGPELARAVVDAARARRQLPARRRAVREGGGRLRGYSGPGPDPRDPQPLGAMLARLVKERGWEQPASEARLFGMWESVVGADLAAHCRPVKLEEGELTVEAESTTWAMQLKGLTGKLMGRIADGVGRGVVTKLNVHGPVAPSWAKGPKRVRGRGPRDTYG
jgi:predicted nucleic acid-binding Zn ribbon protein